MKPYKFSQEMGKYIPKTKKGNRDFYYDRLQKLVNNCFNPHTTFGKYVMRKTLQRLRKVYALEKEVQSLEGEIMLEREIQSEELEELKWKKRIEYRQAIKNLAIEIAYKEEGYLKYDLVLPIFVTVSYFVLIQEEQYDYFFITSMSALIYLVLYFLIRYNRNIIFDKHTSRAKSEFLGKTDEDYINEFIEIRDKKERSTKQKIEKLKKQKSGICGSIKRDFSIIMSDQKLNFILSDEFYNSTDWISIRDRVLRERPNFCVNCQSTVDLCVDHINPRSKFPEQALDFKNTQILCRSCNSSKSNNLDWMGQS